MGQQTFVLVRKAWIMLIVTREAHLERYIGGYLPYQWWSLAQQQSSTADMALEFRYQFTSFASDTLSHHTCWEICLSEIIRKVIGRRFHFIYMRRKLLPVCKRKECWKLFTSPSYSSSFVERSGNVAPFQIPIKLHKRKAISINNEKLTSKNSVSCILGT